MGIKILTYNIHSCIGVDRQYAPARICDVISRTDADIVALQEIDSSLEVTDGVDQLQYFAGATGLHAVMGPTLKRGYGSYGNALLSRWPISDVREIDLTYRRFEPRGLLAATVQIDGTRRIRVLNTHLGLRWWERQFQVSRILTLLDEREKDAPPFVLLGDFNEWFRWSRNVRAFKQTSVVSAEAKTFPSNWPQFHLDRIFASPQPLHFRSTVIDTPASRLASDHLPLLAEIEF